MDNTEENKIPIGAITIGQSPRTDVTIEIKDILPPYIEIVECGALDGLSLEEIKELEPAEEDLDVFVSRLKDGTEVILSHHKIINHIKRCIKQLEPQVKAIIIFCTGIFTELSSKSMLIQPSKFIMDVIKNLFPSGHLGILIPTPKQAQQIKEKWAPIGNTLHIESLSPYDKENLHKVSEVASKFQAAAVDMIILDCIGYNTQLRNLIKKETNIPVLLSNTLVAKILSEIL